MRKQVLTGTLQYNFHTHIDALDIVVQVALQYLSLTAGTTTLPQISFGSDPSGTER
jgi:hypothetical protein